ncbi:MAG: DUF222 domain-containing protein, partial [Frankiaceae bacterium]|nr:DUF222 domain-containing protein [Frankiaceae bacterium]
MGIEAVTRLNEALDVLAAADPRDLKGLDRLQLSSDLLTVSNRLDAVISTQLQVIDIEQTTEIESGRKTRGWLVEEQCRSKPEASRRMTVARAMPEHPVIADAFGCGEISLEHAQVILRLLRSTPPELRDVVEKALVDAAAYVDPSALAAFCREVKQNLGWCEDKDAADQRRYDSRWLTVSDTIEGMTSISGMLDPAGAAALKAALHAMMSKGGEEDTRTSRQRRADALVSLANRALKSGELPQVNGEPAHLTVTLAWNDLKASLDAQAAHLAGNYLDPTGPLTGSGPLTGGGSGAGGGGGAMLNGTEISIGTARMLACDAGIIPALLGSHGEILDLGRKTRTWSTAQHRALLLETGSTCGWVSNRATRRATRHPDSDLDIPVTCQGPADHAHHILFWTRD